MHKIFQSFLSSFNFSCFLSQLTQFVIFYDKPEQTIIWKYQQISLYLDFKQKANSTQSSRCTHTFRLHPKMLHIISQT